MFTHNYATVINTNGIKNLFVGEVLHIDNAENPQALQCSDLSRTRHFVVPASCLFAAADYDIHNNFLTISGNWAFHISHDNTIHYLTKITKVEMPYVFHEYGSDMIYNFKAALDDEITAFLIANINKRGLMKGSSFISKSDKKTYFVKDFKLDKITKKLILDCIEDVSKVSTEKYEDDVKKINSVLGKNKDLLAPGDIVSILLPNAPSEFLIRIDKLDLNSFYSNLTDAWYDFDDDLKSIRKATLEEKNLFESFDYNVVLNSLFSLLGKFHEKFPVRHPAFMFSWVAFEREYYSKYEQLIEDSKETFEESSENPTNS